MSNKTKLKLLLLVALAHKKRILVHKLNRKKRWAVRPVNRRREQVSRFLNTFATMSTNDTEEFYKYIRLHTSEFQQLVSLLKKSLTKRSCINSVPVEERLAITLR